MRRQIVDVPNYSRGFAVSHGAFLSKHDFKLTLSEGAFFGNIDDSQDPAEFLKGFVMLGQEAVRALSPAAKAASEAVSGKLIAVYEFEFDAHGKVMGLKKLAP